jgi:hypothetical protein
MQRCGGNSSQPADLTISDQRGRQGNRNEDEREDQDGWDPKIDDRQAGVTYVSWYGPSDEPEHGQQDYWKSNPGQKANRFAQGELGLDLEQLGELTPDR